MSYRKTILLRKRFVGHASRCKKSYWKTVFMQERLKSVGHVSVRKGNVRKRVTSMFMSKVSLLEKNAKRQCLKCEYKQYHSAVCSATSNTCKKCGKRNPFVTVYRSVQLKVSKQHTKRVIFKKTAVSVSFLFANECG